MPTTTLPRPILMLVTDRTLAGGADALVRKVSEAIDAGVTIVQLREKDLSRHALQALGRGLADTIGNRALFVVNGTRELALEIGADGLHLPEKTALAGNAGLIFGRSVHSVAAAKLAAEEGFDYVVAGPVFPTASHLGAPAAGIQLISEIAATVRMPIIGIGGIDAGNAGEVMRAGASGVAVISAILAARDVAAATSALRAKIDSTAPVT